MAVDPINNAIVAAMDKALPSIVAVSCCPRRPVPHPTTPARWRGSWSSMPWTRNDDDHLGGGLAIVEAGDAFVERLASAAGADDAVVAAGNRGDHKGRPTGEARASAAVLLRRLNIPERLMAVPPATFPGGEQQRVNIARGFLPDRPVLLLDEPTASLDAENRAVVIDLIAERKRRGVAVVAVIRDEDVPMRSPTRSSMWQALRPEP